MVHLLLNPGTYYVRYTTWMIKSAIPALPSPLLRWEKVGACKAIITLHNRSQGIDLTFISKPVTPFSRISVHNICRLYAFSSYKPRMVKLKEVEDEHFAEKPATTKDDTLLESDNDDDYTDTGMDANFPTILKCPAKMNTGRAIYSSIHLVPLLGAAHYQESPSANHITLPRL